MKKRLISCLVVCMLFVSSLALVACGDRKVQSQDVYKQTNELIEFVVQKNEGSKMLQESTVENVSSKYVIKYFDKSDSKFKYYNQLFINPMNFIEAYKEDLQRINEIKVTKNQNEIIDNYSSSLKNFKLSYNETLVQYERLSSFSQTGGVIIEGAEQLFINELNSLIADAYKSANLIAEIKDSILNDYDSLRETVEKISATQIASLKDYISLKLGVDINDTLLNRLQINKITTTSSDPNVAKFVTEFVNPLFASLDNLSVLESKADFKEIGAPITKEVDGVIKIVGYKYDEVANLLNNFKILNNERAYYLKSLDEFNLYGFYRDYGSSMEACAKKVKDAENYYAEIISYSTEIMPAFMDYFTEVFVA